MTIYDESFGQFRPRPPLWRLAAVSVCQFVLAAMLANALAAAYEVWVMSRAEVPPIVVEVTPWSTSFTRLAVRTGTEYGDPGVMSFGLPVAPGDEALGEAAMPIQNAHMDVHGFAVAALLALALLVAFLWPTSPRLGSRMFVHTFAEMVIVAALFLVPHEALLRTGLWYELPPASMLAGLLALTTPLLLVLIERRAMALLGNVYPVDRVRHRLLIWLLRIAVPATLLGGASYAAAPHRAAALLAYGLLAGATFIAALRRPPERFEQLTDPELQRGFGVLVLAALAIVVASFAVFGIKKTRAVTITAREVKLQRWDALDFAQRGGDRAPDRRDRR